MTNNTQPQDTGAVPSIEAWWWETNGTGTASCPKCHKPYICAWHAARLDDLEALIQQRVLAARIDEHELDGGRTYTSVSLIEDAIQAERAKLKEKK